MTRELLPTGTAWRGHASFTAFAAASTGVMYSGSLIKMADISDGVTNTYLAGEKNLAPDYYSNGVDYGDNESALVGDDQDVTRWTGQSQGARRFRRRRSTPPAPLGCIALAAPPDGLSDGAVRWLGPYDELFH